MMYSRHKKLVLTFIISLLLVGTLVMSFNVKPAEAIGTIYIRADGSIDPVTAPISSSDNVTYIFTENIYDTIDQTARFQNSITYSMIILLILIGLAAFIVPYFAQKKVSQQFIFKDIKNLSTYIDKVKKEMEIGVTQEEIDLLKSVSFKKKSILDTDKKGDDYKRDH